MKYGPSRSGRTAALETAGIGNRPMSRRFYVGQFDAVTDGRCAGIANDPELGVLTVFGHGIGISDNSQILVRIAERNRN